MIYDKIKNANQYKALSANMKKALEYLETTDFSKLDAGKYPIDGDNVYAMVQCPTTKLKADAKWEGHKNYADIQYVVAGDEIIGVQAADEMIVETPYNETKDILFFAENGKGVDLMMKPGYFTVLFPSDAHMPLVCTDLPTAEKKVVVKFKV